MNLFLAICVADIIGENINFVFEVVPSFLLLLIELVADFITDSLYMRVDYSDRIIE